MQADGLKDNSTRQYLHPAALCHSSYLEKQMRLSVAARQIPARRLKINVSEIKILIENASAMSPFVLKNVQSVSWLCSNNVKCAGRRGLIKLNCQTFWPLKWENINSFQFQVYMGTSTSLFLYSWRPIQDPSRGNNSCWQQDKTYLLAFHSFINKNKPQRFFLKLSSPASTAVRKWKTPNRKHDQNLKVPGVWMTIVVNIGP